MNGNYIRRIRPFEDELIRKINSSGMAELLFSEFGRSHVAWVESAISEVKSGVRMAFGTFERDGDSDILVASIIAKREAFSEQLNIKNLLIDSKEHSLSHEQEMLLGKLLKYVITFAEYRGFSRIVADLPIHAFEYLKVHLSEGFRIESVRESTTNPGSRYYVVTKQLVRPYIADPFDLVSFSQWLVSDYFQLNANEFKVDVPSVADEEDDGSFTCVSFKIQAGEIARNNPTENIQLRGIVIIDDNENEIDQKSNVLRFKAMLHKFDIRFLISRQSTPEFENECNSQGIRILSMKSLCKLPGTLGLVGSMPGIPDKTCIGGIFVEVGKTYVNQLSQWKGSLVYVLPNGHGGLIPYDESGDQLSTILFACSDKKHGIRLYGIGEINTAETCDLDNAWEKMVDFQKHEQNRSRLGNLQFWTKREFTKFFSNFQVSREFHKRVTLLYINESSLLVARKPIQLKELPIGIEEIQSIERLVSVHQQSSCYVSKSSIEKIRNHLNDQNSSFQKPERTFGGNLFFAILNVLDLTSSSSGSEYCLMQKVRHQMRFGNRAKDEKFDDGTAEVMRPGILLSLQLSSLLPTLDEMMKANLDPSFSMIEKKRYQASLANRASKIIDDALNAGIKDPEMKSLFEDLLAYFENLKRV